MTNTFTVKSNARRRARAVLGADAVEGTHYTLTGVEGAWGFERIEPAASDILTVGGQVMPNATWAGEAKRVKAEAEARKPKADAPAKPKGDGQPTGKSKDLVTAALSPEGITTEGIKAMTGWSKIGGFYGAIQRAGVDLHRVREANDTRWFAVEAGVEGVPAYLRTEAGGVWSRLGVFADEQAALAAVDGDYAGEAGKSGGFFIAPRASLG